MPFTSPFGSIMTPSFNPSYSNVPQNKPPKPVSIPQNKPPTPESLPESPTSSVEELNAGITPHMFSSRATQMPEATQFNPMPMTPPQPFTPMVIPQQFNPYQFGPGVPQRVEMPELPRRVNPYRPIFV